MTAPKKQRRRRIWHRPRFRRKKSTAIPLLPTIAVANRALIQPIFGDGSRGISGAYNVSGDMQAKIKEFIDVIGINFLGKKFSDGSDWGFPWQTYTEIGTAVAAHWALNKFGVNKYMKKIPMVGKYISL